MVDEMDLLRRLKDAEPVRPDAFEEAKAVLRAALAVEGAPETKTAPSRRPWRSTRRMAGLRIAALGTAAAAAAVAVAVALALTPVTAPGTHATASGKPAAKATAAAVNPVLARLAADIIVPQVRLAGNATLEIRNQSPTSRNLGANGIDLYTDGGTYYWGADKSDLVRVIAARQDIGQGQFTRAIAAALIAAKGDITTARLRMAIANLIPGTKPDPAGSRAVIDKLKAIDKARGIKYAPPKPLSPVQRKEQTDSFIWMNSIDALTAVPDNARVRAGVLAIMATMPDVKVTRTTTMGQPTLTLSDSWPDLAGGDTETLVINASTGFPVAVADRSAGERIYTTYYHTSRVTLADIAAGKF